MVSAASAGSTGCARAAIAANAMTQGNQRRMTRQTWWVLRRRATPCGRRTGDQLSLAMAVLLAALAQPGIPGRDEGPAPGRPLPAALRPARFDLVLRPVALR